MDTCTGVVSGQGPVTAGAAPPVKTQTLSWQTLPEAAAESWQCDIVWGGNELALENLSMPGLDGCLLSIPCNNSSAGGDIYHVTVCDRGVFSKFLLIDVAGHGEAAAQISGRLKQPLARLMSELDNSAILEALNHRILANEANGSFATAAAATYNDWDNTLTYAYAGHPYMLIRRNGHWQQLPECCAGPPIGILGELSYFQNEVQLEGKDWLLLFSDALLEIKLDTGDRLGFKGLVDLLNRIEADNIAQLYQSVLSTLVTLNGSPQFEDDLTLILLKQRSTEKQFGARTLAHLHRLMMRWMKRKDAHCTTVLPELPHATNV